MKNFIIRLLFLLTLLQVNIYAYLMPKSDIDAQKVEGEAYYIKDHIRFYKGNTVIESDLFLDSIDDENSTNKDYFEGIVVEGDLHIKGSLINKRTGYNKFLQVHGNLYVDNIIVTGTNITVSNTIYIKYLLLQWESDGVVVASSIKSPMVLVSYGLDIRNEKDIDILAYYNREFLNEISENIDFNDYILKKGNSSRVLNILMEYYKKHPSENLIKKTFNPKNEPQNSLEFLKKYAYSIKIDNNEISKTKISLEQISKITYLDISENVLYELPEYFSEFISLKKLELYKCNFYEFPKSLFSLKYLEYLDLSNNRIKILPNSIKKMQSLREINLNHNRMRVLSKKIGKLQKLKKLNLGVNWFASIPEELYTLQNLEHLNIELFKDISIDKLAKLKNLTTLNIGSTHLSLFPSKLVELKKLVNLDISSNELSALPREITEFKNLKRLDLSHNNFEHIPRILAKMKKLTKLDMAINDIHVVDAYISEFEYIEDLNLDYNDIKDINVTFPYLKSLSLEGTNLKYIPRSVTNIKTLENLKIDNIESIDEHIGNLINLKSLVLDASDGKILDIPSNFSKLQKLQKLDLRYNYFTKIPSVIFKLKNLKSLEMYDCKVTKIPKEIENLKSLEILSLGNNKINDIHENIGKLSNLKELYLGGNKIKLLPTGIADLKKLNLLDISDNPIKNLPSELINEGNVTDVQYYFKNS